MYIYMYIYVYIYIYVTDICPWLWPKMTQKWIEGREALIDHNVPIRPLLIAYFGHKKNEIDD